MAFGNNATRVFFFFFALMVMFATSTAKRPVAKEIAAPAAEDDASGVFDITKLGATSDGKTDCSKEIQEMWDLACKAAGKARVLIPKGEFLSGPLNFSGPCKGDVTIQIERHPAGHQRPPQIQRWQLDQHPRGQKPCHHRLRHHRRPRRRRLLKGPYKG
uniref:Uncharacterized protein n=1 Tax=Avena sativa TaxID=4498 RepID=A0ACD5U480_AVESA